MHAALHAGAAFSPTLRHWLLVETSLLLVDEVEPDDDETPQHEYCAPTAARDDYTATRTARPRWTRAVVASTTQAR